MGLIWFKEREVKLGVFCNGFILIEDLIDDDCLRDDITHLWSFLFFYDCLLHLLNFLKILLRDVRDCLRAAVGHLLDLFCEIEGVQIYIFTCDFADP